MVKTSVNTIWKGKTQLWWGLSWSSKAIPVAFIDGEWQVLLKLSNSLGWACNSLGPRPWHPSLRPWGTDKETEKKSSFSKTRHILGRAGNGLGPEPVERGGFLSWESNSSYHIGLMMSITNHRRHAQWYWWDYLCSPWAAVFDWILPLSHCTLVSADTMEVSHVFPFPCR